MPISKEDPPDTQPALDDATVSTTLDLCSSNNFSAESPPGALVRPCSMSLTVEGANPTSKPISARVIPFLRRSEMREAQVLMPASLRESVGPRQRQPVTVFRQNLGMLGEAKKLESIGDRVRHWREKRGLSRAELAKLVGAGRETTISSIELGTIKKGSFLGAIAKVLKLNLDYVLTGEGDPEMSAPASAGAPRTDSWLFPNVPRSKLEKLDKIERSYIETKMLEALADIEAERKRPRTG